MQRTGGSSADIDYTASVEIRSADSQSGQTYASSTVDESTLLISTSDKVTTTNPTVTKSGESDGGSNEATLNTSARKLSGAVKVGSNSTLTLNLTNGSGFEGYIDREITNAGGTTVSTEAGTVAVTLGSTSTWTLTGAAV